MARSFELVFVQIYESEMDQAFALYKSAIGPVIEQSFGWNEEFQQERFRTRYEQNWFYWVDINTERVGYVCFYETAKELHVSLLIVLESFRNKSFGQMIMDKLQKRAFDKSLDVSLSTFKANIGAVRFYKRMGYVILSEDDYFYDMVLRQARR